METTLNRHGYAYQVNKGRFSLCANSIQATIMEYKQAEREVIESAMKEFLGRELIDEDFKNIEIVHTGIKELKRLEYSTLAYNGEPLGRIKTSFSVSPEGVEEVRVEFWPANK